MSNDELLADSLRALQESTDGSSVHAARTRMQILARASERSRHRRRAAFVVMPLAAALIASTAWGAVTGRLPRWIDMATGRAAPTATTLGAPPEPRAVPLADPRSVLPAAAADREPDTSIPTIEPPSIGTTKPIPTSIATSVPTSTAFASARTPAPSTREQSLYATAHQAHFVDRDPAAALRAWDAYLVAHPDGRFAIEARYNRAISLVRLGRRSEARDALAPFAEGKYGGYRRAEARELLDALVTADGGLQTP